MGVLSRSAGRRPTSTARASQRRPEAYRYDPTFDKCLFTRLGELQQEHGGRNTGAVRMMVAKGPHEAKQ
jgi:hypothetical protein